MRSLFLFFCFLVFVFGVFFHSFSLHPPLSPSFFFFVDAFLPFMFSILFFSLMTHDAVFFLFFADAPNVTKTTQKDQSFVVYAILSNIPFIFFPIVQQTYHMYLVILQFKQMFLSTCVAKEYEIFFWNFGCCF